MKSPPVATLWQRCAVTENSKTRGQVVEDLRLREVFHFYFLMVDDRRACSYAGGDDPVRWKTMRRDRV